MSPRQQLALSNPVGPTDLVAIERFEKPFTVDGHTFLTTLMVNKVAGAFFWCASVSVLDLVFNTPRADLNEAELKTAHAVLHMLLIGVGQSSADKFIYDDRTLQIRRPLTIEEERLTES